MEIARKLKSEKESGVWGAARWRRGRKQADFAKRYEGLGVYCSIFNWSFEAGGRRGGRGGGGAGRASLPSGSRRGSRQAIALACSYKPKALADTEE